MKLEQIEQVLRILPEVPGDADRLKNEVWREIRHRKTLEEASNYAPGFQLVFLRSIFAPTAVVGLVVGALVAWVLASAGPGSELRQTATTTRVLDLEVFGPQANGLAYGRLVVNR
jgi:hypothetical protein